MPSDAAESALYQRVGEAIKAARTQAGLTQIQLADLIDSKQGTVSDWETARSPVPLHAIPVIEDVCDLRRGSILRQVGLVDDNIEAALASDPALDEWSRRAAASYYVFIRDKFDSSRATR